MKAQANILNTIVATVLLATIPHAPVRAAEPDKPNILFIFSDDQSYETIGAHGHTDIDTPNIDRLVERGTTFTHAYNMGSNRPAVCVASRAMLITGRTLWRSNNSVGTDSEAGRLWPQRMAAQGYETYFTGKWHIQADAAKTFTHSANIRGGMPGDRPEGYIITHMDTQIGRILDALEESGKADNTWIIFTSDHGLGVGHHGLMGKQNMYDHSLRVPFIMTGPGVEAGAEIDVPIYFQDAMATALDLAGAEREGVEFQSIRPLLAGEDGGLDAVYGAYMNRQRAVIHDGWKLILYPTAKVAKLYHRTEDPLELNDLAADPAMAVRKKALFAKFEELQARYNDKLKLDEVFPELK